MKDKIIAAAVAGAAAWFGQIVTLGGRVDAIEKAVMRIEQRVDGLAGSKR